MFTQDISFLVAFFAGIVSFASPCILPMIPAYISYVTGTMDYKERSLFHTLHRSIFFVLGFSLIFIIMGASASYLGQLFFQYKTLVTRISGVLIIIFGLHMVGILKISFFYRQVRFQGPKQVVNWSSSLFLGMAFGAGWTPCVGTILSSILLYASTATTVTKGIYLLTAYSFGLGVPFLLTALILHQFGGSLSRLNKYTPYISKIGGSIMILLGFLIFFDMLQVITQYYYMIFG